MPVILTFDPGNAHPAKKKRKGAPAPPTPKDRGPGFSAWALTDARIDGRQVTVTFLARGMCESSEAGLRALFANVPIAPDVVGIEAVAGFAFKATANRGGGQAVVAALMRTSRVVGMIETLARQHARVVTMTAMQARRLVLRKGNAGDDGVRSGVESLVRGLPKSLNSHTRDALLLGVAVAWTLASERRRA